MEEEPTQNLNLTALLMKKILVERACKEQGIEPNNYPGYEDLSSKIVSAREYIYKEKLQETFLELSSDSKDLSDRQVRKR